MAEADDLREVTAIEILAKIEKGETIKYDHARITGDIDISKLKVMENFLLLL